MCDASLCGYGGMATQNFFNTFKMVHSEGVVMNPLGNRDEINA